MLQYQPEEIHAGHGSAFHPPRLGVAKAEAHLTVVTSDDILFPHHLKEFERSIPLISVDQA